MAERLLASVQDVSANRFNAVYSETGAILFQISSLASSFYTRRPDGHVFAVGFIGTHDLYEIEDTTFTVVQTWGQFSLEPVPTGASGGSWAIEFIQYAAGYLWLGWTGFSAQAPHAVVQKRDPSTLALIDTYLDVQTGLPGGSTQAKAVSPAGDKIYMRDVGSSVADQNFVYVYDIATGISSQFASYGTWSGTVGYFVRDIKVASDGRVIALYTRTDPASPHFGDYDHRVAVFTAAGASVFDFQPAIDSVAGFPYPSYYFGLDTAEAGIWITNDLALTDSPTWNHHQLSGGALLTSFQSPIRQRGGILALVNVFTPPPNSPPAIPTVACAPASTVLTSPTKTAGCNPGGTGWTPTYTGPSGTVPVGADPVDGETLTGKPGVHVWAETTHLTYPAETVETMRWAMTDLDDVTRKEGRLLSVGDVEYSLSDGQSNMTAGTIDIQISDLDGRPIGTRLVGATTKYFQRDEMTVYAISSTGRRTGAIPRRIGRGLLQSLKYGTPAVVDFSAVDPFFCDGGAFGPDKKVPSWTIPPYYINAPIDVYAKFLPIIIGEKSDEGAKDPVTNLPMARGKCPLTFVGMDGLATGPGGTAELWGRFNLCLFPAYQIIGLYGSNLGGGLYGTANATSDGATPSVVTLGGSPNLSGVAVDGSVTLTLYTAKGRLVSQITAKSGSTVTLNNTIAAADATAVDWIIGEDPPARVKIDLSTRNGQDCMVFGYPNYVRSTTYEDIMGPDGEVYRVQDIWVRGPLLDDHLAGIVTLAANVIGVEDKGDGTGLPITDYFTAYNWFIENCILVNSKMPKGPGQLWPQTDGDLAAYADSTYMVRGSSFVQAQADSAIGFGWDGLKVNAYFGEGISTRDAIQLWNDNGGCKTGINEHGQVFVWLLDRTADTTTWPRVEHVNRVFGQVERDNPQTEIENVVQGQCDWEPDAERYRSPLAAFPSATAIRHNKGIRKYSKLIDGKLTDDPLQFNYLLQQRLAYAQDGPVYVTFTGDIGLLDYPIGSGIQFTSIMGPGATVGYVDEALIILTKRFHVDSHLVTLNCLDVGAGSGTGLMVDSDLVFMLGDDADPAPVLGDETAVPSTAMVLM